MNNSIALPILAIMLSSACAADPVTLKVKQSQDNPTDSNTRSSAMNFDQQIAAAIDDLSARTGAEKNQISVLEKQVVSWRNGALGCPEPGKYYTQALVTGALIKLNANGAVYQYHAAQGGEPFLCPKKRIEAPATGEGLSEI